MPSASKKSSKKPTSSRSHHTGTGKGTGTSKGTGTGRGTGTDKGTRTGTGTGTGTTRGKTHTSRTTHRAPHSTRHPNSSLGPGLSDPVLIALLVILGLSTIILFIIGVWLLAARSGWPVELNLTGSLGWTRTISYGTACLILSLLFLPTIIFAILAASTKTGATARQSRLVAVFLASLAFIILVLMTFNAIFFATNGPRFISNIIRDGWVNTVTDGDNFKDACHVQRRYDCEGWEDNSCIGCRPSVSGIFGTCTPVQRSFCPRCWSEPVPVTAPVRADTHVTRQDGGVTRQDGGVTRQDGGAQQQPTNPNPNPNPVQPVQPGIPGCRRFVLRRFREFFIPMSVYTIFLALVLILLSWKTCIDSGR